jgi:glutaminase
MVDMDGTEHVVGDVDVCFPIQSISKVFSLVLAMQKVTRAGLEELWGRVGREPSGDPFNSLVQLERERGIPRNPMINAGALVVDDVLLDFCDDPGGHCSSCSASSRVRRSRPTRGPDRRGADTGTATALANLMADFGNLKNDVDEVLDAYIEQCAASMTTRQLARASASSPTTGSTRPAGAASCPSPWPAAVRDHADVWDLRRRRRVRLRRRAAVQERCRRRDHGVRSPTGSAAAVWSPPLDDTGNSHAGRVALHELAEALDLSIF